MIGTSCDIVYLQWLPHGDQCSAQTMRYGQSQKKSDEYNDMSFVAYGILCIDQDCSVID
jgi:hypothetical protein